MHNFKFGQPYREKSISGKANNTCRIFPFRTCICATINLSNKGQRKLTNQ